MSSAISIKNPPLLRRLLRADALVGGSTALLGLSFVSNLSAWLGVSTRFILIVSCITLVYALFAGGLAGQKAISARGTRVLVTANWCWTAVSLVLLGYHADDITFFGLVFLVAQVLVVGGMAYLEDSQLTSAPA